MHTKTVPCRLLLVALGCSLWGVFGCGNVTAQPARPVAAPVKFPLEYKIFDPDNAENYKLKPGQEKLPPLIVMFPGGLTVDKTDATGAIGVLESFRGKSKILPKSNADPGLPVVLSGLRFTERRDPGGKLQGYDVELQGEFNAVKVTAPTEAMEDLLAGKMATFSLESKIDYAIIATASTTTLKISCVGDKLFIHCVEGEFSFRYLITTYKSPSLKTDPPKGRNYLYQGEAAKLPTMRIL
jgi:hypothetical protein